MFLGFGRQKKLARYKRFNYESRHYNAEKEGFESRKKLIKEQLANNEPVLSIEKESFLLSKKKTSLVPIVLFTGFIIGTISFYHFYSRLKTSKGIDISLLGSTWGAYELAQFASLAVVCVSGFMFIRKSKKL